MIEAIKFLCVVLVISLLTAACQPDTPNQSAEVPMKQEPTPEAKVEASTKSINPENWPLHNPSLSVIPEWKNVSLTCW